MRGKEVLSLEGEGNLPLGIMAAQRYEQTTITLQPDDLLLLYTDGITEAMAPADREGNRDLFNVSRLDALLLDCGAHDAKQCVARVRAAVAHFTENAPIKDDQTLIAVRCV